MMHSPLHDRHVALGAKFAEFGGWEMPLEYAGGGVLAEHTAVRNSVGIFDVSHLGKAAVRGAGAAAYVDATLTNSLAKIKPGKAQYTLCCDDASGGIVDDLIAYYRSDEDVFLIPNAANTAEVVRRLAAAAPEGVTITNLHEDFAVLAVQGRDSTAVLAEVGLPTELEYMSFAGAKMSDGAAAKMSDGAAAKMSDGAGAKMSDGAAAKMSDGAEATFEGSALTVCRTGYTGEHGYELVVPADSAGALWDALLATSASPRPAGLGARDTLRTEMGYPLHGQDISLDVTPVQGRVGWAVGWKKPAFWGRQVLVAEREAGPARRLTGLVAEGRGIPRHGMTVHRDGAEVGTITSGTFSPTLRKGIALALLDSGVAEGDAVTVDVRGRQESFTVTKPPFVDTTPKS